MPPDGEVMTSVSSSRTAESGDAPSRRLFAVTRDGTRALEQTRDVRDKLWTGVKLAPARER